MAGVTLLPVTLEVLPDRLVVRAGLPGFSADEIDVWMTDRSVTISTHRPPTSLPEQRVTGQTEGGNWFRRVRLPRAVQPDRATVTFQNGELVVTLPRVSAGRSPLAELPGGEALERPEIPLRTSAEVMPPGPGPHLNVFKP